MDREFYFQYSINSSRSHISYLSGINGGNGYDNIIQDSILYHRANLRHRLQTGENLNEDNFAGTLDRLVDDGLNNLDDSVENNSNSINSFESYDIWAEMSLFSNNHQQTNSNITNNDEFLDDPDYLLLKNGRASTAPARPINEGEEFKWSVQFVNLEKAVWYSNRLIQMKPDSKFDVDSEEGSEFCKKFLEHLEKLIKVSYSL
jgi:hypothetical protein